MLRAVLALLLWLVTTQARAESVVFVASDVRRAEWSSAVSKELAVYGISARYRQSPDARSPLERSAVAQRLARNLGAAAAIWIETDLPEGARVRAVAAEGEYVAEAILPKALGQLEPRVLAALVANVMLEALGRTTRIGHSELGCEQPVVLSWASACTPCMPPWSSAEQLQ